MKKDEFAVHQGFDENYLRELLTRDITPAEAVYDLIDNAIDAARDSIIAMGSYKKDKYGLPSSYKDFFVAIRITSSGISILDNCHGFSKHTLIEDAFKIGKQSNHPHGIGFFGVGLKRALLTLGENYNLKTRSNSFGARMTLTSADLSSRDAPLTARKLDATNVPATLISIANLRPGPAHEFSSDQKLAALRRDIRMRYGIFIRKGLHIVVNGTSVLEFGPEIRKAGPIPPQHHHLLDSKVGIFVESGMHANYRSTKEPDYDKATNDKLSGEYGWYVVCNDRIIEVASKEPRLGFSTSWHPEYNGFLGWVHFVATEPGELPWDTKKSRIDVNSQPFRSIHPKLRTYSDAFRSANRLIRKPPPSPPVTSPPAPPPSPTKPTPPPPPLVAPPPPKVHINQWQKLLPEMNFNWQDAKLESLLAEAEALGLVYSYSCCAVLRMIVERAVDQHLRRSKNLPNLKTTYAQQKASEGNPLTQNQIDEFEPSLRFMIDWLIAKPSYFPSEARKECSQSLGKFRKSLTDHINGAMHKSNIVSDAQIRQIRNETYPLLKFLLESDPKNMPTLP